MNIIIIGYGGMGAWHATRLKESGLFRVVGAYDTDAKRQESAREDGLRAYQTEEELFSVADSFDAAVVATPNDIHSYYCQKLAENGKHVICEKPANNTAKEFEHMQGFSKKHGTVLMVHQNRRWDSDFLIVQKIVDSGIIGRVYRIESNVVGANGIPGSWRKFAKHGGGMMLDWGVHLIDQALDFAKEDKIKDLYSKYSFVQGHEVEDGFDLHINFASGLEYNIFVDTNSFVPKPRWQIFGLLGSAEITDWENNGQIVVKKEHSEAIVGIQAGNGFTKTMAARPQSGMEIFDLPKVECGKDEFYKNFVAVCKNEAEQIVKNEQVLEVLRVMDEARVLSKK